MSHDVQHDQFVAIKIAGMHCHRCQQTIRKALTDASPGVRCRHWAKSASDPAHAR